MDLFLTLAALVAVLGLAAFARWRSSQPAEPLKVRLIDYRYLFIFCVIALMIIATHLATLIVGHPVTGQRNLGQ